MNQDSHHIRLAVGIEVEPGGTGRRVLEKTQCEALAAELAADLARVVPSAGNGLLAVAGSLLEPAELLRPGLPAWQALEGLTRPVVRDHGLAGQLLAIGAYQGRLPDARLRPSDQNPEGQFLVMPLLLVCEAASAEAIEQALEDNLFERGAVHPPARARLSDATGWANAHAQLLTANDLIALQHVQMDTAGLGAFWPVVEHVLVEPDRDQDFTLPGELNARWQAGEQELMISFSSFDQHAGSPDDYALWVRAFRSLLALIGTHAIKRRIESSLVHDERLDCLVEARGRCEQGNGLTEQVHPDCGLIAWTLVDDRHQLNLYPLSGDAMARVRDDMARRELPRSRPDDGICYDPDTNKLLPAT
ncbi:MAG: hypothetical protein EA370_10900 [Wenzhouxiangella sp.]|nr:MAG: hypothetical protein EA370_10900 [Wenzhouxiangella sp.]